MRPEISEYQLLTMLRRGELAAFDAIYAKYSGYVYNFMASVLYDKNLAEDLTQELFMRLWEHRREIDTDRNFQAYVFTIARNLVYKESRRLLMNARFVQATRMREENGVGDASTEERLDLIFTNEYIDTLIESMPPARREIFCLSKMQGLSVREVAQRLELSPRTVEAQLYQANRYLRRKFR